MNIVQKGLDMNILIGFDNSLGLINETIETYISNLYKW